ncbi:MAG: DUF1846 domain-containing protein [Paludibacteraceae bacterium]|nr:DUF1846 domain-containing protein [Paludibacteraceae bacterium]
MDQKRGFDGDKYIKMQSEHIRERISKFGDKLYLEFGGKLFDDFHASRVLPGFQPDSKIRMLCAMKDDAEIVIVINAQDIERNKVRGDLGITYDQDVLRLVDAFRAYGLFVSSVVLTRFSGHPNQIAYQDKLEKLGLKVYRHYPIAGYPSDVNYIASEEGFGKCEYVKTERKLVVVTAPGPGSGKMATCLSQLYHEKKRGVKAGYAKFETFPIWNLPLNHPVNIAYEAATADLADVNMIDPWHLDAYGEKTVNYNRDIEIFPVLDSMLKAVLGSSPYKSPTDMGVNMAGFCIENDENTRKASNDEIVRRYYNALTSHRKTGNEEKTIEKLKLIMKQAGVTPDDRAVVLAAREKENLTGGPAAAIELFKDGEMKIITGKTSELLGASSALLLNALKYLAGIPDSVQLISPSVIEPVCKLKTGALGHRNPRLHTDEVLLALSICALTDSNAQKAIDKLGELKNCEVHTSVILSQTDERVFRRLGVNLTQEAKYQTSQLYHQ